MVFYSNRRLEKMRKRVYVLFNEYDLFGSEQAREEILQILKKNPRIRKQESWIEKEVCGN